MELPRRRDRADHIVTPLDDDGGDIPNLIDSVEQLILVREEPAVDEVVRLYARERERHIVATEVRFARGIRLQRARRTLPDGPSARGGTLHGLVGSEQPAV